MASQRKYSAAIAYREHIHTMLIFEANTILNFSSFGDLGFLQQSAAPLAVGHGNLAVANTQVAPFG